MPISLINQMRREAIELLDEARIPVKDRAYKDSKIKYSPKATFNAFSTNLSPLTVTELLFLSINLSSGYSPNLIVISASIKLFANSLSWV